METFDATSRSRRAPLGRPVSFGEALLGALVASALELAVWALLFLPLLLWAGARRAAGWVVDGCFRLRDCFRQWWWARRAFGSMAAYRDVRDGLRRTQADVEAEIEAATRQHPSNHPRSLP